MAKVEIYTTDYCPYCTQAKKLFTQIGQPFTEIDVSADDEKRQWLVATTGQRTVPQIFINDAPIGGFSEAQTLHLTGKLKDLLTA